MRLVFRISSVIIWILITFCMISKLITSYKAFVCTPSLSSQKIQLTEPRSFSVSTTGAVLPGLPLVYE